jgi:type IV fimbrial biogenesis protein FimT
MPEPIRIEGQPQNKKALKAYSLFGFSLLELMMVVTIAGILISIAVPNYRSFLLGKAVQLQVDALTASFRLARSEALRRSQWVVMCRSLSPSASAPTCSTVKSPPQDWATGWLVFVDQNANGSLDAGDPVIHVQHSFTSGVSMVPTASLYTARYRPDGIATDSATTFSIPDKQPLKQVVISSEGRVRVS